MKIINTHKKQLSWISRSILSIIIASYVLLLTACDIAPEEVKYRKQADSEVENLKCEDVPCEETTCSDPLDEKCR